MTVELKRRDDAEQEKVDLFTIDGQTYSIPAKPRANIALKYLRNVRVEGQDFAAGVMLEDLLGEEGYTALMEYDDLTMEDLNAIMMAAQKVLLGAIEDSQQENLNG